MRSRGKNNSIIPDYFTRSGWSNAVVNLAKVVLMSKNEGKLNGFKLAAI
jgi:hypothetical protein